MNAFDLEWNARHWNRALFLVLGLACLLRLWGTWYGLPYSYYDDEYHEVMRALELGMGGFNFERTGKGGFYFLLFLEYGLYYVSLKAPGDRQFDAGVCGVLCPGSQRVLSHRARDGGADRYVYGCGGHLFRQACVWCDRRTARRPLSRGQCPAHRPVAIDRRRCADDDARGDIALLRLADSRRWSPSRLCVGRALRRLGDDDKIARNAPVRTAPDCSRVRSCKHAWHAAGLDPGA